MNMMDTNGRKWSAARRAAPRVAQPLPGAAPRRTVVTSSLGEEVGRRVK
jgi:hypothetical protein